MTLTSSQNNQGLQHLSSHERNVSSIPRVHLHISKNFQDIQMIKPV
jgi:hypothetical protein